MAYELVYTRRAREDILKLDRLAQRRLARKMEELAEDPFRQSKKIHDPALGSYRFRIGDYRVIFDLDGLKIIILRVGHRREVYR